MYCLVIPVVIIAGPTAVGKTTIAIELAERMGGEIVGADSRQIYRFMNIGTAKPTPEELSRVPHHLIDIRNPDEVYSAADFARDASAIMQEITGRGHVPFLVGGTGLYIHTLLYGIFEGPGKDEEFRNQMRTLTEQHGTVFLHQELQRLDPVSAQRLHPNDHLRIIRALEVLHLTGRPISEHQTFYTKPLNQFQSCFLVLNAPRPILYERIENRVENMVTNGLFQEVESLIQRGYHAELPAMTSVGYKEVLDYFHGISDRDTTVALIKRNTRRYAKRQLTWFKKYQDAHWIEYAPLKGFGEMLDQCAQKIITWKASL